MITRIRFLPMLLLLVLIFDFEADGQSSNTNSRYSNKLISSIEFFGGPAIANQWGKGRSRDQVVNMTYLFGAGVSHKLNSRFDITGRISFQRKGMRMKDNSLVLDENSNEIPVRVVIARKYDYASLDILGRYYVDNKGRFFVGFGGYVSNLRKGKIFSQAKTLQGAIVYTYYLDDFSNVKFDYGLTGMIGYSIPVRPKLVLQTHLITSLGLFDIAKRGLGQNPLRMYIIELTVGINLTP